MSLSHSKMTLNTLHDPYPPHLMYQLNLFSPSHLIVPQVGQSSLSILLLKYTSSCFVRQPQKVVMHSASTNVILKNWVVHGNLVPISFKNVILREVAR